jgi:magnesium-transporting ATPase (P-type)
LALATEPPYEELLQREPTKRNEFIINGRMWKHIIIQSICQIILLVLLYLYGPEFIKEQNLVRLAENKIIKYCYSEYPGKDVNYIIYGTVIKWTTNGQLINLRKDNCGKYSDRDNLVEAYTEYINVNYSTTHMCIIFNIFVFYTLFNQINCRVIDDSFNIFIRMNKSILFPLICFLEMGLQVVIIYIGKEPFHIINDGFSGEQWGICIGLSAITFIISFIIKLVPIENCIDKLINSKKTEKEIKEIKEKDILEADNKIIQYNKSKKLSSKFDKYEEINSPMGEIESNH